MGGFQGKVCPGKGECGQEICAKAKLHWLNKDNLSERQIAISWAQGSAGAETYQFRGMQMNDRLCPLAGYLITLAWLLESEWQAAECACVGKAQDGRD